MKRKILLLTCVLFALVVNAQVYDLTQVGTDISDWTIGDAATLNESNSVIPSKYSYDIVGGVTNETFITSIPNVVFQTKNSSDKQNVFTIFPGARFVFQGKNSIVVIKNTEQGDRIILKVAAKGVTAANFEDESGVYPKNAYAITTDLTLPAKEVGAAGADGNGHFWRQLEYVSLGGDVEIKEFAAGYTIESVRVISSDSITVRLDPNSVDWASAYAYVWTGSTNVYDAYDTYMGYSGYNAIPVIWAQQAQIDEEGWFAVSFQLEEGATYHLGWMANTNNGYPSSNSYILTNQTGSVCTEFNSNGSLQATVCKNLLPDESNTYAVHVATAGTFGQVLLQALGTKTWTDVLALTVTGTLNEADMQYLGRMTNLQILDLSGTNITSIGGCEELAKLQSVTLPTTCIAINDNAFYGCRRLKTINLSNIQTIGDYAFYQCQNLSSLTMPRVLSVGNYAFAMSENYYSSSYTSIIETVAMPIVQSIGNYAFNSNQNLASITMPLVTSIGQYAFCNCYALTQVDLSNVTSLGQGAFYMDETSQYVNGQYVRVGGNLQSVTLSDELEIIPNECFYGCDKLTSLTFPSALKEIGQGALPYLTNVQLPDGLQAVGSGNFLNATSITIPASVTSWESFSNKWTDVYCYVVSPLTFSVFNTSNAANMTLHVPAISMAAYRLHDNWYQFGQILPIEGNISELNINSDFLLSTTDGIANKANMTINDGAALTMSSDQALALGSYVQEIGSANRQYRNDYRYDANGYSTEYYYSYLPYTGLLLANSPMIADGVDVKLVVRKDQWNFFSLPFDVNMSDILCKSSYQWVIREYSGANRASGNGETWNNVPANGVLHAYNGYIIYMTDDSNYTDYTFGMPAANNANKQNIFATNDVDVPLTEYSAEFPQNRSWNLVGNPYPCSFDIQQMDFEAPITTWNGNGYTAYSPLDDNYMLRPAEGFFVQAPQGATAITFHKEGRSAVNKQEVTQEEYNNGYYYYAPRRVKANSVPRKVFNFTLSNADYSDRARLVLNENASADYELTRDAAKMLSTDKTVPQLYLSDNGIRYAINERPEGNGVFYMSAFFGKSGEYSIKVQSDEVQSTSIILTDTQANVATDLTEGGYTFTTESGTFDNRFVITFVAKMPTGVGQIPSDQVQSTKMIRDGQLIIIRNGIEYNVNGQMTK